MPGRLKGKICIVTAAGQGIGSATAQLFAIEGGVVHASDINGALLTRLKAANQNIHTAILDVTNSADVVSYIEGFDKVDVLFNVAGMVQGGSILDTTESAFDNTMELNVKSMFTMCKQVLPKMVNQGAGSVINMSSVCSSKKGAPKRFAYGTSKAAVIGLTKSIAIDFIKDGIRCNCICPGTVDTPSLQYRIASASDPVQARKDFIARQPIGRLGRAEEIANLALFLAADESSYMTGQDVVVDGGWSC